MKKYFSLITFFVLSFTLLLVSCDKDKDPAPKTKTQLLVQANWKFKTATANGGDVSILINDCQKDNLLSFSASGAGNVNEGASKCTVTDPNDIPFTWSFASGETIINVSTPLFANGGTSFTLISLTETDLVVEMPYNPPVGASILMKVTFMH